MKTLTLALLVAAASAPLVASAQTTPTDPAKPTAPKAPGTGTKGIDAPKTDTPKKEKLAEAELQIIAHYHGDNLTEIDLARFAAKRSTNPQVKTYAETLIRHHEDFDKQLQALVKKTGQAIPQEKPDTTAKKDALATTKRRVADLRKLNGPSFDREYLIFMTEHHDQVVANIDTHIAEAKNPDLVQALRDVKPVLQGHADRARELAPKDTPSTK